MAKKKARKKKEGWDRWDNFLLAMLVISAFLKIWEYRLKANIINERFLFDFWTIGNGGIFLWENAPPAQQLWLGSFSLFFTLIWIFMAFSLGLLVTKLAKRAGWF